MRYFFQICYNGKNYNGWQSQPNVPSVQEKIEKALFTILREKIAIVASGRTDTGVHCIKQYFHADIEKSFEFDKVQLQLNIFLPKDISITGIFRVREDASARYDAFERTYHYHITKIKDPLRVGMAYHYFKEVDVPTMNKAAALLCGTHDFQCFSKVNTDVNHFICTLKKAKWNEKGNTLVFTITGNRFLRSMVRAIIGTLLDVGTGKISVPEFENIIKSKDRKKAGMNAPPEGLYLVDVKYPKRIFIK
ncbi:MAG: tRNA pseudouridine(38-40) synthase TruA [Azospira oryzae]|nr:MAG: tRNA pseudouridine(38-40) synthase TruA [Azospira oryzae]